MRLTVISIVVSVLGAVTKTLKKDCKEWKSGRIETSQTIALLKSARIPRRVLKTRGDSLSLRHQ